MTKAGPKAALSLAACRRTPGRRASALCGVSSLGGPQTPSTKPPIPKPKNSYCSYYQIPFYFKLNRDLFKKELEEKGVITNISYKNPIHLMPAYKNLGYKKGDLPITEYHCEHTISLPIFDYMPIEFVNKKIKQVNEICDSYE